MTNNKFITEFDLWFRDESVGEETPERILLRAILVQAMLDLSSNKIENRHSAFEWFLHRSKTPYTFRWICWWLDYDARKLLRQLQPLLRLEAQRRYRPAVRGERTALERARRRLKWKNKMPPQEGKLGLGRFMAALRWAQDAQKQRSLTAGEVFGEGG